MKNKKDIVLFVIVVFFLQCQSNPKQTTNTPLNQEQKTATMDTSTYIKSEEEWKKVLTDEEFHVLREAGTERAYTGKYTDLKDDGNYYCKACGHLLFTSTTKYHSGCGWPAFYDKAGNNAVITRMDYSFGMTRIEVLCKRCESHLGHVFDDGPKDKTGLRYCINSISLTFEKAATDTTKTK